MDPDSMALNDQNSICLGAAQISSDNYSTCIQFKKQPTGLENNTSFVASPNSSLTSGATYYGRISSEVKDAAGNKLGTTITSINGFIVDETLPSYLTSVIEVEGGNDFSCARKSDGSVFCWGSDNNGQLGDGNFAKDYTVARKVIELSDASDLCVGYQHACAVKSDGKMLCWGEGSDDRLGFGTTEDQFAPVEVKNISTAVSCSLGHDHSCVKLSDKTTRCWGSAGSGQLGNGQLSTSSMTIPVSVYGINNATQISVGGGHACALIEGGSVKCWGDGLRGELGIGIIGTKMTPTTVPFSGTVTQVSAGGYHTCFLKNDGTVWCFGDNQYGQLGDGTNQDRFTPVQASISCNPN